MELLEDILIEAQEIANRGSKEIVLISQDTSRFGRDYAGKCLLPELLEKLAKTMNEQPPMKKKSIFG